MPDLIAVETLSPQLAQLTLNRPGRRNALCLELLEQLCAVIEGLAVEQIARVVVLRGAGPVFSAGLDLMEAADVHRAHALAESVARALQLLRETPLVTIAAAHGGAYAGGVGLLAACDIAIGAHDLKIGFPEARRGLLPALICATLRHKVREGDLRELFLAGNTIDAMRAQQIGILQRVVESEKLIGQAIETAQDVLAGGPETIVATKKLLNQAYGATAINHQQMLDTHMGARHSPEAAEGLNAFLEKRPPRWMARR